VSLSWPAQGRVVFRAQSFWQVDDEQVYLAPGDECRRVVEGRARPEAVEAGESLDARPRILAQESAV